jgi:hypothetical protein
MNAYEICHICVGIRHGNTPKTVKEHRMGEWVRKCSGEGYTDLSTMYRYNTSKNPTEQ